MPPWAPNFYPRSPCGERQIPHRGQNPAPRFLSTLSLRRATDKDQVVKCLAHDFYPRSPCGERLHYDNYNLHCVEISIHALLAESDTSRLHKILSDWDFYPRSPCGERPIFFIIFNACCTFLSTLSLRRATQRHKKSPCKALISIHALLAESDVPLLSLSIV